MPVHEYMFTEDHITDMLISFNELNNLFIGMSF